MTYSIAKFIFQLLLALSAGLFFGAAHATTPANWKDSGFAINASGMRLGQLLREFGQAYGVNVSVKVDDLAILKGRLKADNGTEFLDRLSNEYKFNWFVYAGTLYVVPRNDNLSVRLDIGEDAVLDAKSALIGVGLFDTRFGWGELPDDGVVLINGPREYVRLAETVLNPDSAANLTQRAQETSREPGAAARKKLAYKGKQVMIFRLKYASAVDRVITVRGQKETAAGIKTIMTEILGQADALPQRDAADEFDAGSDKRSRRPKSGPGGEDAPGNSSLARSREPGDIVSERKARTKKEAAPSQQDAPRIDADPALNAIIIYDVEAKRDMYRALIEQLDVEPQQIEIEAMIVDIDRSKLLEHGAEWGFASGKTQGVINGNPGNSIGSGQSIGQGASPLGMNQTVGGSTILLSNPNFYLRLKEMESNGDANILAKPTVLTLDNVAAVLDLSQTRYVPLVGERVSDLANITAGTMLRVVPRVLNENGEIRVRLDIDIEDGALGNAQTSGNTTRSTISTQAIVNEQQTLMIGGYHVESTTVTQQKVPFLGDLPLVGGLFRSSSDNNKGRERLFLITPRLLGTAGVKVARRSTASRMAREVVLDDLAKNPPTEEDGDAPKKVPQHDKPAPVQPSLPPPTPAAPSAAVIGPRVYAQPEEPAATSVQQVAKAKCSKRTKPNDDPLSVYTLR